MIKDIVIFLLSVAYWEFIKFLYRKTEEWLGIVTVVKNGKGSYIRVSGPKEYREKVRQLFTENT